MEIKVTIPSDQENDWIDAFGDLYNYQSTVAVDGKQVPNPVSKKEFALEKVNNYVQEVFVSFKAKGANTTRQELVETARNDISGATVEEVEK